MCFYIVRQLDRTNIPHFLLAEGKKKKAPKMFSVAAQAMVKPLKTNELLKQISPLSVFIRTQCSRLVAVPSGTGSSGFYSTFTFL